MVQRKYDDFLTFRMGTKVRGPRIIHVPIIKCQRAWWGKCWEVPSWDSMGALLGDFQEPPEAQIPSPFIVLIMEGIRDKRRPDHSGKHNSSSLLDSSLSYFSFSQKWTNEYFFTFFLPIYMTIWQALNTELHELSQLLAHQHVMHSCHCLKPWRYHSTVPWFTLNHHPPLGWERVEGGV